MSAVPPLTRRFPIVPVPKPRQTRADKWKKRPAVLAYRAFADECRLRMGNLQLENASITFWLPMPKSWPTWKQKQMDGTLHRQKPDLDNLLKALFDALYGDDSSIASIGRVEKRWAWEGAIEVNGRG